MTASDGANASQRFFARLAAMALASSALLCAAAAYAVERFPPPDFTDHQLPQTVVPSAYGPWHDVFDFGVLIAFLALASYWAVFRRWRAGLLGLSAAALFWLGFVREGCVCPIGATQNITFALVDGGYAIPWIVVAFFVAPIVFTLFFGRTFCAAVCPLGAVQELVAVRPVQLPRWVDQVFGLLAFVYLGLGVALAATGAAFVICRYDPFVALFRREGSTNIFIIAACFLVVGLFIGRPYCRFLCPYGALLGLISRVSQWHVRIPPRECVQCRLCEEACPYGAINLPTIDPTPAQRTAGRRGLALALALAPVFLGLGLYCGSYLRDPFARLDREVQLAERVYLEDAGLAQGTTDASDAFRNSGRSKEDLFQSAQAHRRRAGWAGTLFGGWVGLVLAAKLVQLNTRRRRLDFEPNRAKCVSCGRCFWYCPKEQERLGLLDPFAASSAAAALSAREGNGQRAAETSPAGPRAAQAVES